MGASRWAGLALAGLLTVGCDGDGGGVGVEQVCRRACECEGATLPSHQERCTSSCTNQLAGVQLSQDLIDCYQAASCVELATRDVCGLDDDGPGNDVDAGFGTGVRGDDE